MKTILYAFFFISVYGNAQTPTPYDRVYQDPKITKSIADILVIQNWTIGTAVKVNALINDSLGTGRDIGLLQAQVKSVIPKVTALVFDSLAQAKRLTLIEAQLKAAITKVTALVFDSLSQGKKITTLQTQVKQLQTDRTLLTAKVTSLEARLVQVEKINSLTGDFPTGSVKLTKVGTSLLYKISNTDVTSLKPGNMTVYYKLKVDELLVRMAAQEKFNIQLQSSFLRK